jgi:uncharacterized membrane protein
MAAWRFAFQGTHSKTSWARAHRAVVLILLKILAAWTAVSIAAAFAFAPALSRRLRDVNFPAEEE